MSWDEFIRRLLAVILVLMLVSSGTGFFLALYYYRDQWIGVATANFGATVVAPLAASSALVIVLLLQTIQGPIEFKGFGFEFKGASGPLILWVICFLAFASGIRMFWKG